MKPKETDSAPRQIPLGNDLFAIVDADLYSFLSQYQWTARKFHKSWYAFLAPHPGSGSHSISMHRLIANPGPGEITHHRNRNSLDNRRDNLQNMTRNAHEFTHKNNSLLIKFDPVDPPDTSQRPAI